MCYAISNDYDDAQHCSGYNSWELIPHGAADGMATLHSLFPNMWSRSWWRKTAKAKWIDNKIHQLTSENKVMVFSKSWCPYSQRAKKLLSEAQVKFEVYELDLAPDGADLQGALAEATK